MDSTEKKGKLHYFLILPKKKKKTRSGPQTKNIEIILF